MNHASYACLAQAVTTLTRHVHDLQRAEQELRALLTQQRTLLAHQHQRIAELTMLDRLEASSAAEDNATCDAWPTGPDWLDALEADLHAAQYFICGNCEAHYRLPLPWFTAACPACGWHQAADHLNG